MRKADLLNLPPNEAPDLSVCHLGGFLVVLPRIYGFSTLGRLTDMALSRGRSHSPPA